MKNFLYKKFFKKRSKRNYQNSKFMKKLKIAKIWKKMQKMQTFIGRKIFNEILLKKITLK